jgi:uncharacterized SAM-binding protein YcdF (DUF218 family)
MSELLAVSGSVTGLVLGLLVGVVWLWLVPRSRGARWWLTMLLVAFAAASTHVVSRAASWPLRRGFHSFTIHDAPSPPRAVVVLGAGARTVHGVSGRMGVLTLTGSMRVLEAARVFHLLGGDAWVVSSGGPPAGHDMIPESEVMKVALVELGVPASKILLESASHVTRDEAIYTAEILRARGIASCIVVTSDIHMRRALGAFRRVGLQAMPAIAPSPISMQSPRRSWLPTSQGIEFSQDVLHEYVGLTWYVLRGWI